MKVIDNENTVFFDVDETLIQHCAYTDDCEVEVEDPIADRIITVNKHYQHIRLLKEEKARGRYIVVWSAGGYQWAENVIKALDLSIYVDLVMTKPLAYVDDKPITEWLSRRIYISPETRYKNN